MSATSYYTINERTDWKMLFNFWFYHFFTSLFGVNDI